MREEAKARGRSTVTLRRTLERASGCNVLRFSCALWVYNCSGLPLALQKVRPACSTSCRSQNCLSVASERSQDEKSRCGSTTVLGCRWRCTRCFSHSVKVSQTT